MNVQYAAGLIDGEGYIGIQESGGSFQVRLKVTMADKGTPALRSLESMFGGRIESPRPATESNRATLTWRLTGKAASLVLEQLRPHLLVKCAAADIALEMQAMVDSSPRLPNGRATWTDSMRERASILRSRIQEANRRGPDPVPPTLPSGTPIAVYRHGWWWEPEDDLFGPVEFQGKWPTCGRMVAGHVYATTPWEGRCPASSSSRLLPTVKASNNENRSSEWANGPNLLEALTGKRPRSAD